MPPDFAETATNSCPETTTELDVAERFVVRSFRRWVVGLRHNDGGHWKQVWGDFASQFGDTDGKAALSGFARLIQSLQSYARRGISYHQPCCPCLSADEISITNLVAACQGHHLSHAHALAEWLVQPDGIGDLLDAASQLAHFMESHGLLFPVRANLPEQPLSGDAGLRCVTVH